VVVEPQEETEETVHQDVVELVEEQELFQQVMVEEVEMD
jgi:hypothetical protein